MFYEGKPVFNLHGIYILVFAGVLGSDPSRNSQVTAVNGEG